MTALRVKTLPFLLLAALAVLLLAASVEGQPEPDTFLRDGRPLKDVEVVYVGEDSLWVSVSFGRDWSFYSVEMMPSLVREDYQTFFIWDRPMTAGSLRSWDFHLRADLVPGMYETDLLINRTDDKYVPRDITKALTIDYRPAIVIRDVHLVRARQFTLRIEVEVFAPCTDFELWVPGMEHHDLDQDTWTREFCPPGLYAFETQLRGYHPYPGAPPDDLEVQVHASVDEHHVDIYGEYPDPRVEVETVGGVMPALPSLLLFGSVCVTGLVVVRRKRRTRDGVGSAPSRPG